MTAAAIVRAALGARYTAAVLRVERGGRVAFEEAFGSCDDVPGDVPVSVTTAFDLASLTKVFVSTAMLHAVARGAIALDAPAHAHLAVWRDGAHAAITPRMLLAHTGGLQSGADYRTLLGDDVERFALARELVAAPGERVVYSDLGFIALGVLLARACGTSLARAVAASLPEGARDPAYRPRNDDARAIPATEHDAWRGRVRGAVHDEKAYLMNGVAGHAGLFGTAAAVGALAEAYLAPLHDRATPAPVLPAALARDAIAEHGADTVLRRGLGWALKTSDANSCGAALGPRTFGHTGFTGTCVWADPERDLTVVLLTNAVYYGRRDLRDLRAAVNDACVAEFG